MFDFWYDLPPILRACFALVLIVIAVGTVFLTGYIYRWNVVMGVVGLILLLFSGSGSNKSGYNF